MLESKPFYGFLKVLSASEISADVVRLTADTSPFADRRGNEIAIFLVVLDALVGFSDLYRCFHFDFSFQIDLSVCLSARTN